MQPRTGLKTQRTWLDSPERKYSLVTIHEWSECFYFIYSFYQFAWEMERRNAARLVTLTSSQVNMDWMECFRRVGKKIQMFMVPEAKLKPLKRLWARWGMGRQIFTLRRCGFLHNLLRFPLASALAGHAFGPQGISICSLIICGHHLPHLWHGKSPVTSHLLSFWWL